MTECPFCGHDLYSGRCFNPWCEGDPDADTVAGRPVEDVDLLGELGDQED